MDCWVLKGWGGGVGGGLVSELEKRGGEKWMPVSFLYLY